MVGGESMERSFKSLVKEEIEEEWGDTGPGTMDEAFVFE